MNYPIDLDSPEGKAFGFTSDKFEGYLWQVDDCVYVSAIISKLPGQGNVSRLLNAILEAGYSVKVPTPSARMTAILQHLQFDQTWEWAEQFGEHCEVWVKEAKVGA